MPIYSEYVGNPLADLRLRHRYTNHHSGDVLLLYDGDVVGGYVGESLDVNAKHKGKGLSIPLIHVTVPQRDLPLKGIVSAAGQAALTAAWQGTNGNRRSPLVSQATTAVQINVCAIRDLKI